MPFDNDPGSSNQPDNGGNQSDNRPSGQQGNDNSHQQGAPTDPSGSPDNGVFMVVGDRAFRSQEDVAKKIQNADQHISTLESERQKDREELQRLRDESSRLSKIVDNLPNQGQPSDPSGKDNQTDSLSNEELVQKAAELVEQNIASKHTESQQINNLKQCEQKAKELYGDNYTTTIRDKGKELGMTGAKIDALGKESPEAFARLFLDSDAPSGSPAPSHEGGIDSRSLDQQDTANQGTPKNFLKLKERDRISEVTRRLKEKGVEH